MVREERGRRPMQDGGREAFGEDTMESEEEGYFGSEDRGEKQYGSRIDYRQELNLSGRNLSYLPSQHLASTYVSLTTLNISGNAISRLEGLPQTLTSLDASNNLLRSVSGLEESFSLANLVLDHNSITGLSGLENCTSLAELSVSNNDLRSLSGLECCVNLTRINATSNHIANIESLRTLSLNTKLSWMGLNGNPCASTGSHRFKLCGLLPQLLLLDDVRMPKGPNTYRPCSPKPASQPIASLPSRPASSASSSRPHTGERTTPRGGASNYTSSGEPTPVHSPSQQHARRPPSPHTRVSKVSSRLSQPTRASMARDAEQQTKRLQMSGHGVNSIARQEHSGHGQNTSHRPVKTAAAPQHYAQSQSSLLGTTASTPTKSHRSTPTRARAAASPHGAGSNGPGVSNLPAKVRQEGRDHQARDGFGAGARRHHRQEEVGEFQEDGEDSRGGGGGGGGGVHVSKGVIRGLHEQTEKLYQCHVLEMGVITKQQQQINDLKRELKIVKSAITYINSRTPTTPSKQGSGSPRKDGSVTPPDAEASETFGQLVLAREALVKAMQFADDSQRMAASEEYLEFRASLIESGMISAVPVSMAATTGDGGFDLAGPTAGASRAVESPPAPPRGRKSTRSPPSTGMGSTKKSGGGGRGRTSRRSMSESVDAAVQDCDDECADEIVTAALALRNVVKLGRMEDCEPEKIEEYSKLLEECGVLEPYEPPPELLQFEGPEYEEHAPDAVLDVMKKVAKLNTAKTALRKMMELLERERPGSAVVVRYAGVIESTLLVDMGPPGVH